MKKIRVPDLPIQIQHLRGTWEVNFPRLKLWGVRGSIPTPLGQTEYRHKLHGVLQHAVNAGLNNTSSEKLDEFIKNLPHDLRYIYGGNTTCVSVKKDESDDVLILDSGTGIKLIGDELMNGPCGRGEGDVKIILTHTHWDHIQGLPFFKPMFIPGNTIHFYSPLEDIQSRLKQQQNSAFFPISLEEMMATKVFHHLKDNEPFEINGLKVDFHPLKHPSGCYAYRIRENNYTFIFATDAEFTGDDMDEIEKGSSFFHKADLLLIDSQYSLDESFNKFTWGHTSNTMAVNCGVKWRIKNLVLIHHEPAHSDSRLYENYRNAIEHKILMDTDRPRLFLGHEGMTFRVGKEIS